MNALHPSVNGWLFTTTVHRLNWQMFVFEIQFSTISAFGSCDALGIAYAAMGGSTVFPMVCLLDEYNSATH